MLQDNRFRLLTQISDTEEYIVPAAKVLFFYLVKWDTVL